MVPKHAEHRFVHLPDAIAHQIHYILKGPTELIKLKSTYFLPRGSRSGLKEPDLNQLKNSSHGAKSYEWGPVKMTGIFSSSRISIVVADE